jgi:hypothetical protein
VDRPAASLMLPMQLIDDFHPPVGFSLWQQHPSAST